MSDAFEQECKDVDRLLMHLGLRVEQCRSEGGRLLVGKIVSILEERGVKIDRPRTVPPHRSGGGDYLVPAGDSPAEGDRNG